MTVDDATLPDDCSCIVLAGGRSERMGRSKAALPIGGTSMLECVVARVAPLVREVIVIAAPEQEVPEMAARVMRDRVRGEGPLPALALGLGSVTTPWAFALGCDTPFIRRALLRLLTREAAGVRGVIPRWNERLQPLVALYHRTLATPIEALLTRGERRMQAVAALPGLRVVEAARLAMHDPEGWSFRSLNTPEEYADALRRWADAGGADA
jgi:molybdenum cofactor guanylyltransferase